MENIDVIEPSCDECGLFESNCYCGYSSKPDTNYIVKELSDVRRAELLAIYNNRI